jgi:hypothetical protein
METYDGPAWRLISTLCRELATRNLANRSMRIQDSYVGAFPIPRCIKKKSSLCVVSLPMNDEVRAVQRTRTRTRLPAHAHAHTHAYAHLQLVQADRAF